MKTILAYLFSFLVLGATAQTPVSRTYTVKPGDKIALDFDYPKLVRVSTWDKNEVSVIAHVNINDGQNDSAFVLEDKNEDGVLTISNRIKDMDKIPHRYTVIQDGKKSVFHSREEFRDFNKTIRSNNYMSTEGVDIEVTIEVKVPVSTTASIKSKYGMVELVNFNTSAIVNATYGGIDASLAEASIGKLQATTSYGQIYSNLDLKLTGSTERDFFTSITAEPGKGPTYILKSTYGKIYLRKS